MRMGTEGLELLKKFEGLRLTAYKDSVGVWTIGYGHTSMAGAPKVRAGMKISQAKAEEILRRDLKKYEDAVLSGLRVTVSQPMFDAMVSLCYNIGPANFKKSSVLRLTNNGRLHEAADKFALWNRAGGRVLRGLTRRRSAEADLYRSGIHEHEFDASDVIPDRPSGKPMAKSTTNWAAGASMAAGLAATGRQIAEDTSSILAIAPWAVAAAVIVGAGFWIWKERKRHAVDHGI